jgi:hypothetical protein
LWPSEQTVFFTLLQAHISYSVVLTPRSRVLPVKPTGPQLVEKFPVFYEVRRFITAVTTSRHLSLSWDRSIQSMPSRPTSRSSIYTTLLPSKPGSSKWSPSFRFPTKTLHASLLCSILATCPAHLSSLDLIARIIFGEKYSALSSFSSTNDQIGTSAEPQRGISRRTAVSGVTVSGVSEWSDSEWSSSEWSNSEWSSSEWSGSEWSGSEWSEWVERQWVEWQWVERQWVEWVSGATVSGVTVSGVTVSGVSEWSDSEWSDSEWSDSEWSDSEWSGSEWSEWVERQWVECVSGVAVSGATVSGAAVSGVTVSGVSEWSDSEWSDSEWSGSEWSEWVK